jgi:diguanylate cyclase (GGDEF)-like protein
VDRLACGAGVLVLVLAPVFMVVPGGVDSALLAFALLVSLALTFTLATLAWRRGDPVGGWVILAYLPLALTVAVALLRLNGWLSATWLTLEGSAAAAALAVPLLLLALQARSRERHGVLSRVNKLTQQDALTGLLSAAAFGQQLKAAVSGAIMRREAAAVVLVEVANLAQIRQSYGDAMAEQCLLRAVIKLHRVVRDVDPAGRIGTARFGLIFEGASVREEVQARMVRLVASGLVPARGAAVSVPLRFHVACVMLGERLRTADLLLRDLNQLLDSMSPRSRRPVRFLAADGAAPAAAVDAPESSGLDAGHTDAPESSTPPPAPG